MPRVAPITGKSDVPAEHHAVVDGILKVFGGVRGPYSVLLQSPRLAERVLELGNFFRYQSSVDPKDAELAILVAARARGGAYVWAAHVGAARKAGVREEAIDVIRSNGDVAKLPEREREIVTYARQLFGTNRAEQASFDALLKRHGVPWVVELTASAAYYGFLSNIVSAFEVPAAPDGDPLPR
jgi:4-carboxymuconolactone decarboxylase